MAEAVRIRSKKKGKSKAKEKVVDYAAKECEVNSEINAPSQSKLTEAETCKLETETYYLSQPQPITSEINEKLLDEEKYLISKKEIIVENGFKENIVLIDSVTSSCKAKEDKSPPVSEYSQPTKTSYEPEVDSLYKSLSQMMIEPLEVSMKVPSAPIAASAVASLIQHDINLPCDNLVSESSLFPLSLDCIADQVTKSLSSLSQLQLYTSEQLQAFYENPLLAGEMAIIESFLGCNKNLETHPLFHSLSCYLRCRLGLKCIVEEFAQLNRDLETLASQVWTLETKKITSYGECSDRKKVKALEEFPVAHFNQNVASQIASQLKLQRDKIQEKLVFTVYESYWWKLRVDVLISQGECKSEHVNISILFSFLRRRVNDRVFVDQLKYWLNYVAVSLLKRARKEDYLFLAHHVLRCPAGLVKWGNAYLQTPHYDPTEDENEINIHHIDVTLALLSAVCQPITSREQFIRNADGDAQDQDNYWVWLDSEGEDEEGDPVNLTDDDLLSLLNQIPLANVFRFIFRIRQQDQVDVSDVPLQTLQWLRAFAICRLLLKTFETGLLTYHGQRFKNSSKKFGQLTLHICCNLSEIWLQQQPGRFIDAAMMERLSREYEHVMVESMCLLIRTRLWLFISRLPVSGLTPRILFSTWMRWHSEIIDGESVNTDSIRSKPFWTLLCSKLAQLPEPDLFVFLVTLSAMASNGRTIIDIHFLQLIVWELTEIGMLNETTQELCFKTVKELFFPLVSDHPQVVSFILERIEEEPPIVALAFFRDLPLSCWCPTNRDFEQLRNWLLNRPLDSVHHQLSVTICTRLNYDLENGIKPFLGASLHQKIALLLVEVVNMHGRLSVPSVVPVLASNFITDSVQFLSSFSRSWNSFSLIQWAWHLVLKLRLHLFDSYPAHLFWMLHNPHRAFRNVHQYQDDPQLAILRQSTTPIAFYVALSMTNLSHSPPDFCSKGIDLLVTLSDAADQYRSALTVFHHLFILLVSCPDVLYDQAKVVDVFQRLVQADLTYYKRAKSLLMQQFPGPVLRLVASLIEITIWKLNGLNMPGLTYDSIAEIWLKLLTKLPKWNTDKSALYLIDVLIRTAWPDLLSVFNFRQTLFTYLRESDKVQRPSKGLASRVGSWVIGSPSADIAGHVDTTELITPNPSLPYLTWIILEQEMERQANLWRHLLIELQPGRSKSVEQALKTSASVIKMPQLSANQLILVRYAELAVEISNDHPLLPLVIQRFFFFYFDRPNANEFGVDSWACGQRIMTSSPFLSSLLKRLSSRFLQKETDSFFQSCHLWLEDIKLMEPGVYLPSLSPNYCPARLLQLFQGSDLWIDLLNLDIVRSERQELRDLWIKERNLDRNRPPNRPSDTSINQSSSDTVFTRLQTYIEPVRLAQVTLEPAFCKIPQRAYHNVVELRRHLNRHLQLIAERADQHSRKMAELTALDCHYFELLAEQYKSTRVEKQVTVKCAGTQTGSCSGAALIKLVCTPWRINVAGRNQAENNRQEANRLHMLFQENSIEDLCRAGLLLDDCVEQISQAAAQPDVLEVGASLFYILVELVNEETNNYLPTKQLLSTCLEMLGQRFIAGHPEQCRNLVGLLSSNSNLSGLVAPHFTPSTTEPTSATIDAFIHSYQLVSNLSRKEADLILVLLTKFDIRWWLNCPQCWPADRAKLLDIITSALDSYELQPTEKLLAVHEVMRRHWQQILIHNFPENFNRILQKLLLSSESQSCSPVLWVDFINSLGQGWLRFQSESSIDHFRKQVLQYTTQQTLLNVNQLSETAAMFAQHFSKERQHHGLYGLYPKYRNYIEVISSFMLMIGHGLCFATLQADSGTPSDQLVGQLWVAIRDLYSPWILPYTQEQVSSNCAAWIQQLSSDRKLLLPWIAADSSLATAMVSSASHCINFIHETLPAQQSVLSHLLSFYVHGYCHSAVKPHIFQVMHQTLETLPWHSFVPSLVDLELLVRASGQFLPDVHSFLVSIFVRWPLSCLVSQWKLQPSGCARLLSCLLHLFVRLAGEPKAQQCPNMKRVLDEAVTYPWHLIDANIYDQVLNWFLSTCDALFVIQPFMERLETIPVSNDPLVFRLLQVASGYRLPAPDQLDSTNSLIKKQMFIRSWIRLITLSVSRHRAIVQKHPAVVQNAVTALLQFIIHNNPPVEYGSALHEYMTAMSSSSPIGDVLQSSLCQRIGSCQNPSLTETVLQLAISQRTADPTRVAAIMEAALEHYDGSRDSLMNMFAIGEVRSDLSSVCWKENCLLSWYCLITSNHETGGVIDSPFILEQLLSGCKSLILSEMIEAKLCLVYERLIAIEMLGKTESYTPHKTALQTEWSELLSAWAEENTSWLSSFGLGKTSKLSSKGRCLARIVSCSLFSTYEEAVEQLEKLVINRQYADCKSALDVALTAFKSNQLDCKLLLKKLVPLLYSNRFLTRLLPV